MKALLNKTVSQIYFCNSPFINIYLVVVMHLFIVNYKIGELNLRGIYEGNPACANTVCPRFLTNRGPRGNHWASTLSRVRSLGTFDKGARLWITEIESRRLERAKAWNRRVHQLAWSEKYQGITFQIVHLNRLWYGWSGMDTCDPLLFGGIF